MNRITFLSRRESSTWVPPAQQVLAYLHGGRIFTHTLPYLVMAALAFGGVGFMLTWLAAWGPIIRDFERWRLIAAALVHFAFLGLAYLLGRLAWLRIDHLRRLPQGESMALRSLPILLRTTAELAFAFSVTMTVRLFFMPSPSWPDALSGGTASGWLNNATADPINWFGTGATSVLFVGLWSVLGLVVAYGLANAIETYLAIELNTRNHTRDTSSSESTIHHGNA